MTPAPRIALAVLLVLVAAGTLAAGTPLLVPALLIAVAVAVALLPLAQRRPERVALTVATIVVAVGAIAAVVDVVGGIDKSRAEYRGKLDAAEIRRSFHPTGPAGVGDPRAALERRKFVYLTGAQGQMTRPHAGAGELALWSLEQLAPWLIAVAVVALLFPILRAADRGDPFWSPSTARRLNAVGVLLLLGIPGIALLRYLAAEAISGGGPFAAPNAEPVLSLSLAQILPGVLVLTLSRIFQKGVALRDLERHTV
jgi:Protein of unknown function (DUF2975)